MEFTVFPPGAFEFCVCDGELVFEVGVVALEGIDLLTEEAVLLDEG